MKFEAIMTLGSVADWISASADILLALIAGVGSVMAYKEYSNAQKWKRAEFAAQQLDKFWSDPKIEACCIFLDWEARRMKIPEAYHIFSGDKYFVHSHDRLRRAMNSGLEKDVALGEAGAAGDKSTQSFNWQEVMYRDYFDRFFEFLIQINNSLQMGILKPHDLRQLVYWLSKVFEEHKDIFKDFLTTYKYHQVAQLFEKIKSGLGGEHNVC